MAKKEYYDAQYQKRVHEWLRGETTGLRGQNTFAISATQYDARGLVFTDDYFSAWAAGNFFNNIENNLELLCPNCRSLTSTYRARNKGRGRDRRVRGV